jgi:hypothetical protein
MGVEKKECLTVHYACPLHTYIRTGEADAKVVANVALMDYAVGTINTYVPTVPKNQCGELRMTRIVIVGVRMGGGGTHALARTHTYITLLHKSYTIFYLLRSSTI